MCTFEIRKACMNEISVSRKKSFALGIIFLLTVSFCFAQETEVIELPALTTYISSPVVEQRQVLTEEEIKEHQSEDLPSLLQSEGIQILSYGPYGLEQKPSLRGFTDETVRVVIDGVCVNNSQYGTYDFSAINLNDIEKIEIVRGGFTEGVTDEGAVGGVIYITTKKQQLGINYSFDSKIKTFFNKNHPVDFLSENINFSSQIGDNSFFKTNNAFTFAENKFLYKNYNSEITERRNSEVMDVHSDINFTNYFGNGSSFSFSNIFYLGNKNLPGTATSVNYDKQKDYDNMLSVSLNVPSLADGIKFFTDASWLCNNRFVDEGISPLVEKVSSHSRHYVNTLRYCAVLDADNFSKVNESVGLTFDYTFLDSTEDGKINVASGTLKETTKVFLNEKIIFTLPVAVKFSGKNFAFTPKAGVCFKLNSAELIFNAYRMTQFPNLDDLYWNSTGFNGDPNLKPEDGWGAEITFNGSRKNLPLSVCVFSNYYENKIQWANVNGIWSVFNVASAFYLGIDFSLEKKFFGEKLTLSANAEYLYTKLLNKNNPVTYGKKIMWTPDLTGAFSIKYKGSSVLQIVEMNYVGKRYKSNNNTTFMKPYLLLNYSLTYMKGISFGKKTLLVPYLRADNMLNASYESTDGYPMPGISLTVGARLGC